MLPLREIIRRAKKMANEVKWLIVPRVGFFSMEGDISSTEFLRINNEVAALLEGGQAPIHLIADVSKMKMPPMDIQWIARKTAVRDEKVGIVIAVGANGLLKFIAQMVKNLTKSNIHMVDSMEEAYELLEKLDASLPKLSV